MPCCTGWYPTLPRCGFDPDHAVGEGGQPPHLLAEQLRALALPTVGEDNDDGASGHAPPTPAVEEGADGLAEPGPARPVRHGLPGRHECPVRVALAQCAGHVSEARAHGEHLDRAPRPGRLDEGVGEPQQAVGVGAHRARDVDEQHDPARAGAPGAVVDSRPARPCGAAAPRSVAGPSTAPRRDRTCRRARRRGVSGWRRPKRRPAPPLLDAQAGEVTVPQDLLAARTCVDHILAGLLARTTLAVLEPRLGRGRNLPLDPPRLLGLLGVEPRRKDLVVALDVRGGRGQRGAAGPVDVSPLGQANLGDGERGRSAPGQQSPAARRRAGPGRSRAATPRPPSGPGADRRSSSRQHPIEAWPEPAPRPPGT